MKIETNDIQVNVTAFEKYMEKAKLYIESETDNKEELYFYRNMKKFNFNDIKSCCNEVSIDKLNKIDGGHYIYVKYYNGCNGKLIKTVKQYSNECKCNTYQGTLKVKVY